jgi:hypothetical protein
MAIAWKQSWLPIATLIALTADGEQMPCCP